MKEKIIVGISGASGSIYGIRILEVLQNTNFETHLVLTDAAKLNIEYETNYSVAEVLKLAEYVYDNSNIAAPIASGSFLNSGMVIAPCSIKSLSAIANSYSDNLLIRAADVTLKEDRPLVLMVRETPFHIGHLKLMSDAAAIGAKIAPPLPAFYHKPKTIDDIINHSVGKVLDQLKISHNLFDRWEGM